MYINTSYTQHAFKMKCQKYNANVKITYFCEHYIKHITNQQTISNHRQIFCMNDLLKNIK